MAVISAGGMIKMPQGDGTGPDGMGPKTGRAAGYCAGFDRPGFANPQVRGGRGFGRGMGRGAGFGRMNMYNPRGMLRPRFMGSAPIGFQPGYQQQPTKEQELQMLEEESKAIEEEHKQLDKEKQEIEKRINELKSKE